MKYVTIVLGVCLIFSSCKKKQVEETVLPISSLYQIPASVPDFSGERTLALLRAQVAFGPRVPNTVAHQRCADYILDMCRRTADSTDLQSFSMPGYDGVSLALKNIIARFRPGMKERILLCAHWDSRPRADQEKDELKKSLAIPGANDGASGVAVLLHIAEMLHQRKPDIGVDLVFLDGEDYGNEQDETMYCIGSKYFSASIASDYRPLFGVLLDLVGDAEAVFPMEAGSRQYAGDVVELIWTIASRLGIKNFVPETHSAIYDDHIPLNLTAGIKTVDIIDAELVGQATKVERRKYWHSLSDTPEQCSAQTLRNVGSVLLNLIYGMHPGPSNIAVR